MAKGKPLTPAQQRKQKRHPVTPVQYTGKPPETPEPKYGIPQPFPKREMGPGMPTPRRGMPTPSKGMPTPEKGPGGRPIAGTPQGAGSNVVDKIIKLSQQTGVSPQQISAELRRRRSARTGTPPATRPRR